MALHQYWLSKNRKDLAERAIVSKRQVEAHSAQQRESAARYHRELNLISSQYKNIEEGIPGKTPRVNQESFREEEAKARRREKLYQRQHRLMILLGQEDERYLRELKTISEEECQKDPWNIAVLKQQIEEIKRRRKYAEEVLTKRSMSHLHRGNKSPFFDEREDTALEKEVRAAWEKKKEELQKQAAEKIEEDVQKQQHLQQQRCEAKKRAEEAVSERDEALKKLDHTLSELSAKLRDLSIQNEKLQTELTILKNHQKLLDSVVAKRNDVKDIQRQRMRRIEMFRKSKEKVRKFAAEVKNLLEIDLETLNFLSQLESHSKGLATNLDLQDVTSAIKTVEDFVSREDKRSADLQVLFEEEATRSWDSRKRTWDEELEAHEKIMCSVFEKLGSQIKRRCEENLHSQRDCTEAREELLIAAKEEKGKAKKLDEDLLAKHSYYMTKIKNLDEQIRCLATDSAKVPSKLLMK